MEITKFGNQFDLTPKEIDIKDKAIEARKLLHGRNVQRIKDAD